MNPLDLARTDVRAFEAYSSARMEAQAGSIWLNANESPWPPFGSDAGWNRYPEPQPVALLARLAEIHDVRQDQVLAGRGSDEAIDLLLRAFCAAGRDAIMISPPTFGMYAAAARLQGASVVEVPLCADFGLDTGAMLAAVAPAVKLVFVCSPNNPSGAGVSRDMILRLATALSGRALLVVDEAYVEFASRKRGFGSVADCLDEHANLVVLRTLSKAWALAGARIGILLGDARVVALLRKLMPPYPLPSPCVDAALRALTEQGARAMRGSLQLVCDERERMRDALERLACVSEVLPSEANFLAVRFDDAEVVAHALRVAGIVVRDVRRHPSLADALRVTVGAPDENDSLLAVLRRLPSAANRTSSWATAEQQA